MATIEISDVLDELSQDLRQQLLTTGSVSTLMVNQNALKEQIICLKDELKFAEKCLTLLNEFKRFFNGVRHRFEDSLNTQEKRRLTQLENGYQRMVKAIRPRIDDSTNIELKDIDDDEDFLQDFSDNNEEYLPDGHNSSKQPKSMKQITRKPHIKSFAKYIYRCPECQMVSNRRTLMKVHLKKRHGINITLKELIENKAKRKPIQGCDRKIDKVLLSPEYQQELNRQKALIEPACISITGQIENKEDNKDRIDHSFVTLRPELASESDFVNEVEVIADQIETDPAIQVTIPMEDETNTIENKDLNNEYVVYKPKNKSFEVQKTETEELKSFQCEDEECDSRQRYFKNKELFERHIYFYHTFQKPIFKCEKCSFVTQISKEALEHRTIHQSGKPYFCPICQKRYHKIDYIRDHIPVHSEQFGVNCKWKDCDKKFKSINQMHSHYYKLHMDCPEKHEWPCDWPGCEFIARNNWNLKHHKYIHTGEKPYKCEWPYCDKSFRTESAYSTHMRLHKNDQCYSCIWPGCDFKTHDRGTLRFHRLKHERLPDNDNGRKAVKSSDTTAKKPIRLTVKLPIKDRSQVKRRTKKPKRYESDSESSNSEGQEKV